MSMNLHSEITSWWNTHPCELWHSNKSHNTIDFSHEISKHRQTHKFDVLNFFDLEKLKHQSVLEVGCGIGTDGLRFSRLGTNYVGVDISSKSIDIAQQRFLIENAKGQFYVRDASKSGVLTDLGKFDIVFSWGVIHHWPSPEDFLPNFYQALNPTGKLILSVYNEYSWKNALVKQNLAQYEAADSVPYVRCFSEEQIRNMLRPYFEIELIDCVGLMKYNIEKYKKGIFEVEPWFSVMPNSLLQAIEKQLGEFMVIVATPKLKDHNDE